MERTHSFSRLVLQVESCDVPAMAFFTLERRITRYTRSFSSASHRTNEKSYTQKRINSAQ